MRFLAVLFPWPYERCVELCFIVKNARACEIANGRQIHGNDFISLEVF